MLGQEHHLFKKKDLHKLPTGKRCHRKMDHKPKDNYRYGEKETSGEYDGPRIVDERGTGIDEAADMYGDLQTAEDYGYVTRGYAIIIPIHVVKVEEEPLSLI